MPLILWIVLFSLLGGVLSVVAAASLLALPTHWQERLVPHLVSFATGALLGAAFLAILPHALESSGADAHELLKMVLGGILGFFVLEKLVLWRHCHTGICDVEHPQNHHHTHAVPGYLIIVGDGIHNFVDGVLIAAAFLTDIHLGVVTSLAVAAHEIPQELGDFAVLLHSGLSRIRAFVFNMASSLTTVIGALLAYVSLEGISSTVPYVLAIAAASFIYIAVADLIPGLHRRTSGRAAIQQFALISVGVLVIYSAHSTLH